MEPEKHDARCWKLVTGMAGWDQGRFVHMKRLYAFAFHPGIFRNRCREISA
jgi:hypothetical protein